MSVVQNRVIRLFNALYYLGKRHNRVHPGHFATQQGIPFYPAGMSAADWSTLVFTLPRRKMAWVHPTMATFFQNCTLILDKYPVVSENETLPPAISPTEITLRFRQRAPKYTSSRAKHTVRNRHQGPASSSAKTLHALNIQWQEGINQPTNGFSLNTSPNQKKYLYTPSRTQFRFFFRRTHERRMEGRTLRIYHPTATPAQTRKNTGPKILV